MAYKDKNEARRKSREYYWKHREHYLIQMNERRNKNKDIINKENRERYKNDSEYRTHRKQLSKENGKKRSEKKNKYMKKYYPIHQKERLEYLHNWQDENRDELRKKIRDYAHSERGKKGFCVKLQWEFFCGKFTVVYGAVSEMFLNL